MKIKNLKITNFKIHRDIFLNFQNIPSKDDDFIQSKNIIIGDNSTGKTSILEAILLFSGSNYLSFSSEKNKNLINSQCQNSQDCPKLSVIEIETDTLNKFKVEITNARRSYFVNNKKILSLKAFSNLPKILNISPNLQYIFLSKDGKRELFENLILNLDLNYLKYKNDYIKLCQKRTYLIGENNFQLLDIIEKQIVDIGFEILKIRKDIHLHSSNKQILFKKEEPILKVFNGEIESSKDEFISFARKNLKDNRNLDFKAKRMFFSFTRFDFDIFFENQNYNILSNSQQKQCIYEYIISNIEMISEKCKNKLILLIDEIDSFFDEKKMNIILDRLDNKNILQIISTTPKFANKDIFNNFLVINI